MEVRSDFKNLLELFNVHNVKYMIVGGYALAFHGAPRYTGDIDILVKPDADLEAYPIESKTSKKFCPLPYAGNGQFCFYEKKICPSFISTVI